MEEIKDAEDLSFRPNKNKKKKQKDEKMRTLEQFLHDQQNFLT